MSTEKNGKSGEITRRVVVRNSMLTAAGVAAGVSMLPTEMVNAEGAIRRTRSFNPEMEYRRLGKTNMWLSAVCLGGHWKRIDKMVPGVLKGGSWLSADLDNDGFRKNRRDIVTRCSERGINYIDACTWEEVMAYSEALRGRRESMYLGFSWYQEEMRNPNFRTCDALMQTLDKGMQKAKLEYVDLWRIVMNEVSATHSEIEIDEMMKALDKARKQGKVRFTGLSSHDRPHIKWMIETYPTVVQVVVLPYTAKSKVMPTDSVFDAIIKNDVGFLGIKPFASNSLFKGNSVPGNPHSKEDDRMARLAVRYILCNPAITAPIPGMVNIHQVDNMALAVKEHRELDNKEQKDLADAMDHAWKSLPDDYQWLKQWEYV